MLFVFVTTFVDVVVFTADAGDAVTDDGVEEDEEEVDDEAVADDIGLILAIAMLRGIPLLVMTFVVVVVVVVMPFVVSTVFVVFSIADDDDS